MEQFLGLSGLVEEMEGVLEWLGIDVQSPEELFGIADAFAWMPIWDGGNGDKYDAALCRLKDWGERVVDYLTDENHIQSVPDKHGVYHDIDKAVAYQARPLGTKVDPNGPDVQYSPER
ncbi:MAG TPA: hypothetical protein VGK17_09365 [Propionicimonas sp.]|jgi:hypothetical protein